MNAEVIDYWASELQRALFAADDGDGRRASSRTRLSRSAAQREACALLSVVHGIRCAALVSTFATTCTSVQALSALLRRHTKDVFVLVHVASEQTFVVHCGILRKRLAADTSCFDTAFISVDQTITSQDVETHPPQHLVAMLSALRDTDLGHATYAVLLQGKGDGETEQLVALAGVALAGWLLEYPAAYYYRSAQCHQASAVFADDTAVATTLQRLGEAFDDADMTGNNLAGKSLALFSVQVRSQSSGLQTPLTQFTIPMAHVAHVAATLGLPGRQAAHISQHIERRLSERISDVDRNVLPSDVTVHVDWSERTMDRVAL